LKEKSTRKDLQELKSVTLGKYKITFKITLKKKKPENNIFLDHNKDHKKTKMEKIKSDYK